MGYTHYWRQNKKFTQKQWDKFLDTCIKLKDNLPEKTDSAGGYFSDELLIIGGNEVDEVAVFNNEMIYFNGQTPDLGHETFCIENNEEPTSFGFCKTDRKPYDLLVCACLIAANKHLKFKITSDGNVNDWKPAFDYYDKVMGIENVVRDISKFLNKK